MKTKKLLVALSLALATTAFVACGQADNKNQAEDTTKTEEKETNDVVTTASIVNDNEAFEKAISKDGTWIIATLGDLTFDKELVVDGDFKNGKKDEKTGEETFQRKIALYTQDENKKVTAKFTLTAPKLTFNSVNGSLQHGTFKGDLYIAGKNFSLVNQTIEGNVYFLNQEAMDTFKIADKDGDTPSKITGVQELKAE
ncbi:hypothetical protein [Clostridium isatidis]|uniref:Lipoprotein n=1 Tax=Clostridium isatidis TaxID=182773 RepID=A0A343JFC3_9CLOT|nr:hypothetical protein [Clostridium isatidis]ASW44231.1 hypothetical protein BEN51_12440 [Clostridium isatidis]NLZ35048.1 hypothetical protein [Clostridiales bacterium]